MDNQETKIRKGQAFNLAVNTAIARDKEKDAKYIFQQFIYYYELAGVVQSSDLDMINEVLNRPDFMEAIENIKKCFEENK